MLSVNTAHDKRRGGSSDARVIVFVMSQLYIKYESKRHGVTQQKGLDPHCRFENFM